MRPYTVEYYEEGTFSPVKNEIVLAKTKEDAYFAFMKDHESIYSAWVSRCTCNNGNVLYFNTFSGNPY